MTEFFIKEGDEFKKVEQFTQEHIDEITGDTNWLNKRLERERSKFADYDEVKEKATKVDEIKSEYETKLSEATTKIEDLTNNLGKAQLETEKVKIITEFKLPDDLAEFVTGDDAEEMRKRAEKLSKGVKPSSVHIDKNEKPDKKREESARMASELFGTKKV